MAQPTKERDPFETTDDAEADNANDSALEKMRSRISNPAREDDYQAPEEGPVLDVEPAPAVDEQDDPGDRPSRQERRRTRYDEMQSRLDAAEKRAEEASERASQLAQAAIARLNQPTPAAGPQKEPYADELASIRREQNTLYREFAALPNPTQEQVDVYERKASELDDRKGEFLASRTIEKRNLRPVNPVAGAVVMVQQKYPQVMRSAKALRWARGHHDQLVADGAPDDTTTMEKSMSAADRKYFGGTRPPATDAARRRRADAPARSGHGGEVEDRPEQTITMRKEFRQMARAKYPGIPESEAMKKWAQTSGRRLVAKQKRSA